jgi:hypothetical protein
MELARYDMKINIGLKIEKNLDKSIKKCIESTNQNITDFITDSVIKQLINLCTDQNNSLSLEEVFNEHIRKEALNLASYWRSQNNENQLMHILALAKMQFEKMSEHNDLLFFLSADGKRASEKGLRHSLEIDANNFDESKVTCYDSNELFNIIIKTAMDLLMDPIRKEVEFLPWDDKNNFHSKVSRVVVIVRSKHVIVVGFEENNQIVLRKRYEIIFKDEKEQVEQFRKLIRTDYGIDVTEIYFWE